MSQKPALFYQEGYQRKETALQQSVSYAGEPGTTLVASFIGTQKLLQQVRDTEQISTEGVGNSSMEIFRNESREGFVLTLFPLGDVYKHAGGHSLPLLPQVLTWH